MPGRGWRPGGWDGWCQPSWEPRTAARAATGATSRTLSRWKAFWRPALSSRSPNAQVTRKRSWPVLGFHRSHCRSMPPSSLKQSCGRAAAGQGGEGRRGGRRGAGSSAEVQGSMVVLCAKQLGWAAPHESRFGKRSRRPGGACLGDGVGGLGAALEQLSHRLASICRRGNCISWMAAFSSRAAGAFPAGRHVL